MLLSFLEKKGLDSSTPLTLDKEFQEREFDWFETGIWLINDFRVTD